MSSNLQGALWIVVGTLLFAANDAAVKTLGRAISPEQITFIRFVVGCILLTPVWLRLGWGTLKTERLVYAALIGYFIFAELPDAWSWAGAGIIVASTLYLARVEGTRARAVAG
jgi:drug/metabolite transporter (DMT)-like permease